MTRSCTEAMMRCRSTPSGCRSWRRSTCGATRTGSAMPAAPGTARVRVPARTERTRLTTPEDVEANPADLAEDVSLTRDAAIPAPPDIPLEAPTADVLEQAAETAPDEHVAARS